MKYPYIGKGKESGTIVMIAEPECGMIIDSKKWATKTGGFETSIDESYIANITHEYLSNTWGVVESKEHAEFIIELAELHGFVCGTLDVRVDTYFCTDEHNLDFTSSQDLASNSGERKITIPLPPKDKEWTPEVGEEVALRYKFDSKQIMHIGKLLYLSDSHIIIAPTSVNDMHCHRSEWEIEKPKSKQDLLIEELQTKLCNNNAVDNYILACDIINGEIEGLSYGS